MKQKRVDIIDLFIQKIFKKKKKTQNNTHTSGNGDVKPFLAWRSIVSIDNTQGSAATKIFWWLWSREEVDWNDLPSHTLA